MKAIADVVEGLANQTQTSSDQIASMRSLVADYSWPDALAKLMANGHAVPCLVEPAITSCPNCGGAGNMYVFVWTSGPRKYPSGIREKWLEGNGIKPGWYSGSFHFAPCPVCQADGRRDWLHTTCGLSGGDFSVSMQDFRTGGPYLGKEQAADAVRMLLSQNDYAHGFLTLWGDPGKGKSHLLKALVNGLIGVGVHARYINGPDLLAEIREHFSDGQGGVTVEAAIQYYRRVRALAIDEFDKIYMTPWAETVIQRLMDSRYNEQAGLLTVLAMNQNPGNLPENLNYLASRIKGGLVIEVAGPDMRGYQGAYQKRVFDLDSAARRRSDLND